MGPISVASVTSETPARGWHDSAGCQTQKSHLCSSGPRGGHRHPAGRPDRGHAVRFHLQQRDAQDRRLPLLLLLPARVLPGNGRRAVDRAAIAERTQERRRDDGGDAMSHVNATTFTIVVIL